MCIRDRMNSGHARVSQWGFSNISAEPDAKVLDVGCGGGANIAIWLDKCRNGHVTGLDYSEISVAESQKLNIAAIKQGKCRVLQGDVSSIPFSDEVFDYVSAFETVYFWPGLDVYKRQPHNSISCFLVGAIRPSRSQRSRFSRSASSLPCASFSLPQCQVMN